MNFGKYFDVLYKDEIRVNRFIEEKRDPFSEIFSVFEILAGIFLFGNHWADFGNTLYKASGLQGDFLLKFCRICMRQFL
ncbi:MAG: hypothetical protein ACLTBZ_05615 [Faecalispora jeddahensis]|uniref:hypothetical protein n=1 Tax=Faecalispora jeddahensis TaxID=1414721 RepID=UPI00399180AB